MENSMDNSMAEDPYWSQASCEFTREDVAGEACSALAQRSL